MTKAIRIILKLITVTVLICPILHCGMSPIPLPVITSQAMPLPITFWYYFKGKVVFDYVLFGYFLIYLISL
jgi:hypothetical protein